MTGCESADRRYTLGGSKPRTWARPDVIRSLAIAFTSTALIAFNPAGAASVFPATPANYRSFVKTLRAGDTLVLSAGEYREGLPLQNVAGERDQPITIVGPEHGPAAIFRARTGRNTISIVDSSYVVIKNLVLEGDNLPVDAVKAERQSHAAHDITLEGLTIRGHGTNQQTVGISTKCPAWNWTVRGNTILGAGTGMYFGDSDGSAPFFASVIEGNLIVDSVGYNLQIKHQRPRPSLPGMPAGPSITVIRHNVFAKPATAASDAPRPNVLVGHFPLEGVGTEDDYAVYGNFFYQNATEALFQGEGNVAIYSNLFVNEHGDAIRIQPHNDVPRRIVVAYNTIVAQGAGISVMQKEGTPYFRQVVTANAVFAGIPLTGGEQVGNLAGSMADAESFLRRPLAPPGRLDLFPRRSMKSAGAAELPASLPDGEKDFDGLARTPAAMSGYGGRAAGPRWLPRLERKPQFVGSSRLF